MSYATANAETSGVSQFDTWWMDEVTACTDGNVTFDKHYSGSLYTQPEMLGAVRNSELDLGFIASGVTPNDLPVFEATGIPFTANNGVAHAQALAKLNTPGSLLAAELERNNVHALFYRAISGAATFVKEPVETLAQLNRQKLRTVGPVAIAFEGIGVAPVAVDSTAIYESVQTGVVDGVGSWLFDLGPAIGLDEVAPWVVDTGLGTYSSNLMGVRLDLWETLPQEYKDCMESASITLMDGVQAGILEEADIDACDAMLAAGGGVTLISETETAEWRDNTRGDLESSWLENAKAAGYSEGELSAFLDAYVDAYIAAAEASDFVPGTILCAERTR
ncbi:TRAP transporter substrate-binding protein DctP [Microbacterium sp. zg-B185]|nr:TRAP transporter substrate-binding protein DctP [Microbacterium sp. zg-B185]MCR2811370.1 TRAP transporter substrate-binding protein DctP [Microbacterium sp. zg.B185]WIM20952.1 TRAP transporter substrate-binding protein DctP [Microbacterium sp. zg-B185]